MTPHLRCAAFLAALLLGTGCAKKQPDKKEADKTAQAEGEKGQKAGEGGGKKSPTQLTGPLYSTPQAVFDAYAVAVAKGEHRKMMECLTLEAQKQRAGFVAALSLEMLQSRALERDTPKGGNKGKQVGTPEEVAGHAKRFQPVYDAMAKHGLTEASTSRIKHDGSRDGGEKAQRGLIALIDDPVAFFVDYMIASDKAEGNDYGRGGGMKFELSDLKEDGDKATGTLIQTAFGEKDRIPLDFVKVGGGWRIGPKRRHPNPGPSDKGDRAADKVRDKDKR